MYYVADEVEVNALKNLPTTWGLRQKLKQQVRPMRSLKNLPTTWGLRRSRLVAIQGYCSL